MRIKSVEELAAPGGYIRHLTPFGLDLQRQMTPESSLRFIQSMVADCDLAPDVPDNVRVRFDRCRILHTYGFFEEGYECFTVAAEIVFFVLEAALGARFICDFPTGIPLRKKTETTLLPSDGFWRLFEQLNDGWRVEGDPGLESETFKWRRFNGSMRSLLAWARAKGLFYGEGNAVVEDAILHLRHYSAHPHAMHRTDAVDSGRAIRDTAELINHLWGHPTPGGRLYPAANAEASLSTRKTHDDDAGVAISPARPSGHGGRAPDQTE